MQGPGREGSVAVGMRLERGRGVVLGDVVVMMMGQRHSSKWRVWVESGWFAATGAAVAMFSVVVLSEMVWFLSGKTLVWEKAVSEHEYDERSYEDLLE